MSRFSINQIAVAGVVAALYTVLSLAFAPISFGVYQVRVAEALTVLPFLLPAAIPGLYVGCLLANVFGNVGWLDIVVGPLITLVAAVLTYRAGSLGRKPAAWVAAAPVALIFAGAVYLLNSFDFTLRSLLGTGLAVVAAGLPLVNLSAVLPSELGVGPNSRVLRVTAALALALVAAVLIRSTDDQYFVVCGTLLLAASVGGTAVFSWSRASEMSPAVLLAPLPPVVLNAFGVSAYLAPIIGVDYWFCVQMVGIGQLIACFILGLPLLVIIHRRNLLDARVR